MYRQAAATRSISLRGGAREGVVPHFADDLISRTRRLGHPLCAGLDPHLPLIPPLFRQGEMAPADPRSAAAVAAFFAAALPRLAPHVAVVKPQSAFFERLGWRGIQVLEDVVPLATRRAAGDSRRWRGGIGHPPTLCRISTAARRCRPTR